jgi:hypothetical protein
MRKPKLLGLIVAIMGVFLLIGCAQQTKVVEDPLLTPFSIGPNSPPQVTPPTTNPPINE